MALETYLDFAENDYKFFMINYRNHVIAIVKGAAAQGICEKYMKHLISEYMNPETKEELAKITLRKKRRRGLFTKAEANGIADSSDRKEVV